MAANELGTYYVTVNARTDGLSKQLDRSMSKAGQTSGRKFTQGLTRSSNAGGKASSVAFSKAFNASKTGANISRTLAASLRSSSSAAGRAAASAGASSGAAFTKAMASSVSAGGRGLTSAARSAGNNAGRALAAGISASGSSRAIARSLGGALAGASSALSRPVAALGRVISTGMIQAVKSASSALTAAFRASGRGLTAVGRAIGSAAGAATGRALSAAFRTSVTLGSTLTSIGSTAVSGFAGLMRRGGGVVGRGFASAFRSSLSSISSIGMAAGRMVIDRAASVIRSGAGAIRTASLVAFGGVSVGIGTALSGGLGRLTAIEDATTKISAMGYSLREVESIAETTLKSVMGTPFSLGEASTVATQLLATGVKPGEELAGILETITNLSTIAGSGMEDVGIVISEIAAKGQVYASEMLQLAQRGIPAYKILGDHLGMNNAEIRKFVSDGAVTFEIFSDAMAASKMIAGQADSAAKTTTGSWRNLKTAWSRMGAEFLTGFFPHAPGILARVTDGVDGLGKGARVLGDEFGERLAPIFNKWADSFARWSEGSEGYADTLIEMMDRLVEVAGRAYVLFMNSPIKSMLMGVAEIAKALLETFPRLNQQLNITRTLSNLFGGITRFIDNAAQAVSSFIRAFQPGEGITSFFDKLGMYAWQFRVNVDALSATLFGFLGNLARQIAATGVVQQVFRDVTYALKNLGLFIYNAATDLKVFETIGWIINGVAKILGTALRRISEGLLALSGNPKVIAFFDLLNRAARYFALNIAPKVVDTIILLANIAGGYAFRAVSALVESLGGFDNIKSTIKGVAQTLFSLAASLVTSVGEFVVGIARSGAFQLALESLGGYVIHLVKNVIPDLLRLIVEIVVSLVSAIRETGLLQAVFRALGKVFSGVVSIIRSLLDMKVLHTLGYILTGVANGIGELATGLAGLIANNAGIRSIFTNLHSYGQRFATYTAPLIANGFTNIVDTIGEGLERTGAIPAAFKAVFDAVEGIASGVPAILSSFRIPDIAGTGIVGLATIVSDISREISNGLADASFNVLRDIVGGIEGLVSYFANTVAPNLVGIFKGILSDIGDAFSKFNLVGRFVDAVVAVVDTLIFRLPQAASALRIFETLSGVLSGMVSIVGGLATELGNLLGHLAANPPRLFGQLAEAAGHFANVAAPQFVASVSYVAREAIRSIDTRNVFGNITAGINSAFDSVVAGFERIDANIHIVDTLGAAMQLISSVIKNVGEAIGGFGDDLKESETAAKTFETIRWVLDHLSNHTIPRAIGMVSALVTGFGGAVFGGTGFRNVVEAIVGFIDRMITIIPVAVQNFGLFDTIRGIADGIGTTFQAAEKHVGNLFSHFAHSSLIGNGMREVGKLATNIFQDILPRGIEATTGFIRQMVDALFRVEAPQKLFGLIGEAIELILVKLPNMLTNMNAMRTVALIVSGLFNTARAIIDSVGRAMDRIGQNKQVQATFRHINEIIEKIGSSTLPKFVSTAVGALGGFIEKILETDILPSILETANSVLEVLTGLIEKASGEWKLFDSMVNILDAAVTLGTGLWEIVGDIIKEITDSEWVTGKMEGFNDWTKKLAEEWVPKLVEKIRKLVGKITEFVAGLKTDERATGMLDDVKSIIKTIWDMLTDPEFIKNAKDVLMNTVSSAFSTIATAIEKMAPIIDSVIGFLDRHPAITKALGAAIGAGILAKGAGKLTDSIPGMGGGKGDGCGCGGGSMMPGLGGGGMGGVGMLTRIPPQGWAVLAGGLAAVATSFGGALATVKGISGWGWIDENGLKTEKIFSDLWEGFKRPDKAIAKVWRTKLGFSPDNEFTDLSDMADNLRNTADQKLKPVLTDEIPQAYAAAGKGQATLTTDVSTGMNTAATSVDTSSRQMITGVGDVAPTMEQTATRSGGAWGTFTSAFGGIGDSISGVWNNNLRPFFTETIPGWFNGAIGGIGTVWGGIASGFGTVTSGVSGVWNNGVKPFMTETVPGWFNGAVGIASGAWGGVATGFETVKGGVTGAWNNGVKPFMTETVPGWFDSATTTASDTWTNVSDGFGRLGGGISDTWNSKVAPSVEGVKDGFFKKTETLGGAWDGTKEGFGRLKDDLSEKWTKHISPLIGDVSDGFGNIGNPLDKAVEGIGKAFDAIKGILRKPMNWIIENVWNNGIRKIWKSIENFPGVPKAPEPSALIPEQYRHGGIVGTGRRSRGRIYGPGTATSDSILTMIDGKIPALIGNGERVLSHEQIEALGGHSAIDRLLRRASRGRLPAFRNGGVVGKVAKDATFGDLSSAVNSLARSTSDTAKAVNKVDSGVLAGFNKVDEAIIAGFNKLDTSILNGFTKVLNVSVSIEKSVAGTSTAFQTGLTRLEGRIATASEDVSSARATLDEQLATAQSIAVVNRQIADSLKQQSTAVTNTVGNSTQSTAEKAANRAASFGATTIEIGEIKTYSDKKAADELNKIIARRNRSQMLNRRRG